MPWRASRALPAVNVPRTKPGSESHALSPPKARRPKEPRTAPHAACCPKEPRCSSNPRRVQHCQFAAAVHAHAPTAAAETLCWSPGQGTTLRPNHARLPTPTVPLARQPAAPRAGLRSFASAGGATLPASPGLEEPSEARAGGCCGAAGASPPTASAARLAAESSATSRPSGPTRTAAARAASARALGASAPTAAASC